MDEFRQLNLIGQAPAFLAALRLIKKFSGCHATVLVHGETGTGKELAARAVHYLSGRRGHPFIPVNCGALPDTLIENELFGHVRGAFTDAREAQNGLIANAEGGTLFLDEIEALSEKGQVVLLRFLQDRVYRPLGGRSLLSGNVRIIAARNTELGDLVMKGNFRRDLYYRLAILSVRMPSLRERPGDAVILARHFVRRLAQQYRRRECELDRASIAMLLEHQWPGNVRELENLIHREVLLTEDAILHLSEDMLLAQQHASSAGSAEPNLQLGFRRAKAAAIAEFERRFLAQALTASHGNITRAARIAGKERRAFGRLLRKHGIGRDGFN